MHISVASASPLLGGLGSNKYTPPPGYYYDAGKLNGLLDVRADVNVNLDVDLALFKRVCTRGSYGGYDAYRCTQKLSPRLDLALNIDLNIDLNLGLGINLLGICL
ncbi:hypothetical protein CONCODRAFT_13745 [Conidiobolus coronatus NRRL 28638]|uniref:Uncharacterized protein n=1 Tax=Conidiobolus coronatus (strain ATCC 28846 / CBS 209.66 / NRRL 28638) TaxID=796925 RepID=A0A137NQ63_CONC2|nr:hypothetical protein CONCODRAFT_13745 [Conidiobolus coronatus NRRL 28638]|eukprot:KXN64888.1 hypothetical protein CONCODRAFT_13745 [Conidiobolus coronatus NRRL 28638]